MLPTKGSVLGPRGKRCFLLCKYSHVHFPPFQVISLGIEAMDDVEDRLPVATQLAS